MSVRKKEGMTKKKSTKKSTKKTKAKHMVLVRTYSAGVHFGELVSVDGHTVTLANARRIWRWFGANTLHEIALRGVDVSQSKISDAVPTITVMQAIEIIRMTAAAVECLRGARWNK